MLQHTYYAKYYADIIINAGLIKSTFSNRTVIIVMLIVILKSVIILDHSDIFA